MIPNDIYGYDWQQLVGWLRHEAGSADPQYFRCAKQGGLKLQQVPEEYAQLLLLLRQSRITTYLELGIGNGGSFALACAFMRETLRRAIGVDDLSCRYNLCQTETEIQAFIEMTRASADIQFVQATTDEFFESIGDSAKFDCIFIDADHSYASAKKDYTNAVAHIADGGLVAFHDVNSDACPGVARLWQEVRRTARETYEFVSSDTCGIGVARLSKAELVC